MSFISSKIKDKKPTQLIARGLSLDELFKPEIIKEFKEKFSESGEIVTTLIQLQIIPKPKQEIEVKSQEKKGIVISVRTLDFIELSHPSEIHAKDGVIVITSNRSNVLERFIGDNNAAGSTNSK